MNKDAPSHGLPNSMGYPTMGYPPLWATQPWATQPVGYPTMGYPPQWATQPVGYPLQWATQLYGLPTSMGNPTCGLPNHGLPSSMGHPPLWISNLWATHPWVTQFVGLPNLGCPDWSGPWLGTPQGVFMGWFYPSQVGHVGWVPEVPY
ncbi:hypothetical protein C8R42DRAFT_725900 [Lentinula raphanica]|nr:hypothetical protein C8R42DRAFT_725900 [Lentinula raphanica]